MKKRVGALGIVLVLLLALIVVACGGTTTTSAPSSTTAPPAESSTTASSTPSQTGATTGEKIIVGAYYSKTGFTASSTMPIYVGIQLAVNEWNEKGGINGAKIEVMTEDDQSTPTGAVNAFNKLLTYKPAFVLAPPITTYVLAIEQVLATTGKLPVITSATNPAITAGGKGGGGWFFRVRNEDTLGARFCAQFFIEELKATKPAIIYPSNDYGKGGYESIKKYLDEKGIPLVATETFNQGQDKDVTAQLNKIKNAGADALFCWAVPADAAMVTLQSKQVGLDVPLIGVFGTPDYLDLVGEASEGVYVFLDTSASMDEESAAWTAKAAAIDPNIKPSFQSAVYYDGTNIALEQIAKGANTPEKLRDAIAGVKNYQGISGIYTFDSSHNGLHSGVILQWQGQKLEIIKKYSEQPQ